jgi:hypothetical protein
MLLRRCGFYSPFEASVVANDSSIQPRILAVRIAHISAQKRIAESRTSAHSARLNEGACSARLREGARMAFGRGEILRLAENLPTVRSGDHFDVVVAGGGLRD